MFLKFGSVPALANQDSGQKGSITAVSSSLSYPMGGISDVIFIAEASSSCFFYVSFSSQSAHVVEDEFIGSSAAIFTEAGEIPFVEIFLDEENGFWFFFSQTVFTVLYKFFFCLTRSESVIIRQYSVPLSIMQKVQSNHIRCQLPKK